MNINFIVKFIQVILLGHLAFTNCQSPEKQKVFENFKTNENAVLIAAYGKAGSHLIYSLLDAMSESKRFLKCRRIKIFSDVRRIQTLDECKGDHKHLVVPFEHCPSIEKLKLMEDLLAKADGKGLKYQAKKVHAVRY